MHFRLCVPGWAPDTWLDTEPFVMLAHELLHLLHDRYSVDLNRSGDGAMSGHHDWTGSDLDEENETIGLVVVGKAEAYGEEPRPVRVIEPGPNYDR